METSLKTGSAQIFSCCPKNLIFPKFGGAAAPLAPPARTPMGGIFFFIERFVCCMTKKSWAFSDLEAAIFAALHETFVRSKYANSVSQFLLYL